MGMLMGKALDENMKKQQEFMLATGKLQVIYVNTYNNQENHDHKLRFNTFRSPKQSQIVLCSLNSSI